MQNARPSPNDQRHFVVSQNRGTLAGHSETVRQMGIVVRTIPALATGRHLGHAPRKVADPFPRGRQNRLVAVFRRWHDCQSPQVVGGCLEKKVEGEPEDHGIGKSTGGLTTKFIAVCDNHSLPLTTLVRGGQASDNPLVLTAVDQVAIRTPAGRIRKRPKKVAGDKGCSSKNNRDGLRKRGITPVIAYKSNEKGATRPFDRETYKKRNAVERMFGHLKECRRVATRYEKLAVHYHAFLKIACIRYLLTKL